MFYPKLSLFPACNPYYHITQALQTEDIVSFHDYCMNKPLMEHPGFPDYVVTLQKDSEDSGVYSESWPLRQQQK